MRNFFLVLLCLLVTMSGFAKSDKKLQFDVADYTIELQVYSPEIVRVLKYPKQQRPEKNSFSVVLQPRKTAYKVSCENNVLILTTSTVTIKADMITGNIFYADSEGNPLLKEKVSGMELISHQYGAEHTYLPKQTFQLDRDETIYGLGQHQEGRMNQRNQHLHLQQTNMDICVPIIHSVKGYALFGTIILPLTLPTMNRA